MKYDAFSRYHPGVNLIFFLGAIVLAVIIQHPAYLAAGILCAGLYYLLLKGARGWRYILGLLPLFLLLTAVNPLFNTAGERVLFHVFGRPYTWEALCYGMAIASIFLLMMLWFGCYNAVMTGDKVTALLGNYIPSLSLLLVMVLRMVPGFLRKVRQISGTRCSIGKGRGVSYKEKLHEGMTVLSTLTDWVLEGSVITADSMRSRGYGTAKRTSFQIYRMTLRDWILLGLMALLLTAVVWAGGTKAAFTPEFYFAPLTWGFPAYCAYLLIPVVIQTKEAIQWRISVSKI